MPSKARPGTIKVGPVRASTLHARASRSLRSARSFDDRSRACSMASILVRRAGGRWTLLEHETHGAAQPWEPARVAVEPGAPHVVVDGVGAEDDVHPFPG